MNKLIKIPFDKQKGTAATLCIVCTVFIVLLMTSGCSRESELSSTDDRSFFQKLNEAPVVLVPKDELPKWLIEKVGFYGMDAERDVLLPKVFRGIWNGRVTYFLQIYFSSCVMCDTYYENGEKINWAVQDGHNSDKFCSESKDWVLIKVKTGY